MSKWCAAHVALFCLILDQASSSFSSLSHMDQQNGKVSTTNKECRRALLCQQSFVFHEWSITAVAVNSRRLHNASKSGASGNEPMGRRHETARQERRNTLSSSLLGELVHLQWSWRERLQACSQCLKRQSLFKWVTFSHCLHYKVSASACLLVSNGIHHLSSSNSGSHQTRRSKYETC